MYFLILFIFSCFIQSDFILLYMKYVSKLLFSHIVANYPNLFFKNVYSALFVRVIYILNMYLKRVNVLDPLSVPLVQILFLENIF